MLRSGAGALGAIALFACAGPAPAPPAAADSRAARSDPALGAPLAPEISPRAAACIARAGEAVELGALLERSECRVALDPDAGEPPRWSEDIELRLVVEQSSLASGASVSIRASLKNQGPIATQILVLRRADGVEIAAFDSEGHGVDVPSGVSVPGAPDQRPTEGSVIVLEPGAEARAKAVWTARGYDPKKSYADPGALGEDSVVPPPEPLPAGTYRLEITLPVHAAPAPRGSVEVVISG